MPRPKGYHDGDWLAVCYQCGMPKLASTMRRHWQGYWVCPEHWELRHPQDFVRGVEDIIQPPWVQPVADTYIYFCTVEGSCGVAGRAVAGCMRPGQDFTQQGVYA